MARPNYEFAKRQRELAKKQKKEAKKKSALDAKTPADPETEEQAQEPGTATPES
jgi:hypothetical protein